ncbi:hypothetical protein M9M90_19655 [Phenylobacterium sp. LH3H17]|uniref:hypothetical protein n=1 Tax=Phenylobacterium sp. LH3H17 TaxID=2903901 RepID=UPI0020CA1DBD|nr:hypothetical protein [Phenylobacterium sp. LH3H17]UTP39398.1 hypothetical protein M9M90_19655 [Phenylobacterium sp. LH3H17]
MVRVLIAAVVFLALAFNGPVAMAATMHASAAMTATMDDCGAPMDEETCPAGCVLCHAMPAATPFLTVLRVAFAALVPAAPRQMVGLNLTPETPPPRG